MSEAKHSPLPSSFEGTIDFVYEVQNMTDATELAVVLWPVISLHHELVAALEKIGGDREYSAADIASHAQKPHKTIDESVAEAALASLPAPEAAPTPDLTDPNVVHANMLRGTIAKPTWEQIKHLYPEQAAAPTREETIDLTLTAGFTKSLPGGALDDSTYSQIEDALDAIDAPMTDNGRYMTLVERILALKAAPSK